MPSAEQHRSSAPAAVPAFGELWEVEAPGTHAISIAPGVWNVLAERNDEYTLEQVHGLVPVAKAETQPAGAHWADQFDALAEADRVPITWAEEIQTYQAQGWDKIRRRLPQIQGRAALA